MTSSEPVTVLLDPDLAERIAGVSRGGDVTAWVEAVCRERLALVERSSLQPVAVVGAPGSLAGLAAGRAAREARSKQQVSPIVKTPKATKGGYK